MLSNKDQVNRFRNRGQTLKSSAIKYSINTNRNAREKQKNYRSDIALHYFLDQKCKLTMVPGNNKQLCQGKVQIEIKRSVPSIAVHTYIYNILKFLNLLICVPNICRR